MATSAGPTKRVTIQSLLLHFLDSASTQYAPGSENASSQGTSPNTNNTGSSNSNHHYHNSNGTSNNNGGYPSNHHTTVVGGGGPGTAAAGASSHSYMPYNTSSAALPNTTLSLPSMSTRAPAPIQTPIPLPSSVPTHLPPMRPPLANTTNTSMNRSMSLTMNGSAPMPTPIPLPENVSIAPKKRKSDSADLTHSASTTPKPKRSRPDPTKPDPLDVTGITLPGESTHSVRVYDTCDTVRHRIQAVLRREGVTQASFLRAIAATYADGRKIQNKQLNDFLAKRGPLAGNRSCIFYASYVFFEKARIRDGREKEKDRVQMEKQWPQGVDTVHDCSYTLSSSNDAVPRAEVYLDGVRIGRKSA